MRFDIVNPLLPMNTKHITTVTYENKIKKKYSYDENIEINERLKLSNFNKIQLHEAVKY